MSFALCNLLSENISCMNTLMRKYTFSKHNKQHNKQLNNKSKCHLVSIDYVSDSLNNSDCPKQLYCNNFTDYCDNPIQNVESENDVVIEF
jgi:hypothetical protein